MQAPVWIYVNRILGIILDFKWDILYNLCVCLRPLLRYYNYVIKFPCSRGVSGALYLQSAIAGVMVDFGVLLVRLPRVSGVEVLVLRDGNL